jgi:hypothetical protein
MSDADRTELMQSISSSAQRLQRLLADLLTVSRLDSTGIHLQRTSVHLNDLLARTVARARTIQPDIEIDLVAEPELSVTGDADRLAQAVDNLISNGVRHGVPPVRVTAFRRGGFVEVSVCDSGQGVSADLTDRLFQRFAADGRRAGTGLGLFIVRELARAHGGDAFYEANPDGGARFVLCLPPDSDDPLVPSAAGTSSSTRPPTGPRTGEVG